MQGRGDAEHVLIEGVGSRPKLRCVGLAQNDNAALQQDINEWIILICNLILVYQAALPHNTDS